MSKRVINLSPRRRLTPPELATVIMRDHERVLVETEERLKASPGNWEPTLAFLEGYNRCLRDVIEAFNCYGGSQTFGPRAPDGSRFSVEPGDPGYYRWRYSFYTNGIAKK